MAQLRELNPGVEIPDTKEGSRQYADRWWREKLALLAPPAPLPPSPTERMLAGLLGKERVELGDLMNVLLLDYREQREAAKHFQETQNNPPPRRSPEEEDAETAAWLEARLPDLVARRLIQLLTPRLRPGAEGLSDEELERLSPADGHTLKMVIATLRGEAATPAERTVKAQVEKLVGRWHARVGDGSLSVAKADNLRIQLEHFQRFLGDDADVGSIDGDRLYAFVEWCRGRVTEQRNDPGQRAGWSEAYAAKVVDVAKLFMRFLWKQELIELPRMIDDPEFRIRVRPKAIKVWPTADVRRVILRATGQLRLHLLLMANTGLLQKSISDLRPDAFDPATGHLTYRRGKTAAFEDVPTVRYLLWPSTQALLERYAKPLGAERLLLTESGRPFVRDELRAGRRHRCDNIASNYARLKTGLPLKGLRKTGATLLTRHDIYKDLDWLWLGHSPRSIAKRHYSAPSQERLDAAVGWLGEQLGLTNLPAGMKE